MNLKPNVPNKRHERFEQLTAGELITANDTVTDLTSAKTEEPDPELLWKQGQGRWNDAGASGLDPGNGGGYGGTGRVSFLRTLLLRTIISGLLFAFVWGLNKFEPNWAMPIRLFVAQSLTHEIDFSATEAWYERTFGGSPSFIPIFKHNQDKGLKVGSSNGFTAPLSGTMAAPFMLAMEGIEIVSKGDSGKGEVVKSIETGRVLSVSKDAFTGITVVVQHAGGYTSIYGRLEHPSVTQGDWVEGGDLLGTLSSMDDTGQSVLYFALKKNDRYIDPTDVIPFD